jgi:hypothetical protein
MNDNMRWICVLFFIVVVVNIIPSFAVQMGQVADDAKDYNDESHKKMGFFGKIKFTVKGFHLISEAKKSEKDSKNDDKQKTDQSDASNYDAKWNKNKEQQTKNLLAFKNAKKTEIASIPGNITGNDTNNKTSNTSAIPEECFIDANNIITQLTTLNITLSLSTEQSVSNTLTGKIVQIIDNNGHLRYLYIKNMDENKLTLITNDEKEITMEMDEFKKTYTGIVLSNGNLTDFKFTINKINELQKVNIQKDTGNVQKLKKEAKTYTIIGSILTGVGVLLLILAVLIAIIYSKAAAAPQAARAADTVTYQGQQFEVMTTDDFDQQMQSSMDRVIPATQYYINMGQTMTELAALGFILIPLAASDLAVNVASCNWVNVVLGIVGIILLICGLGLIIAGLVIGIKNVIGWLRYNAILRDLKQDSVDMDTWLNSTNQTNITDQKIEIKMENQSFNLNKTPLFKSTA